MSDRNERASQEYSDTFSHSGSVWSARAIAGGMTGVAVLALVIGIAALVLAAVGKFPLIVLLLALVGIVLGTRLFLPRLTVADKVLIPVGVVTSVIALVIWLIRFAQ